MKTTAHKVLSLTAISVLLAACGGSGESLIDPGPTGTSTSTSTSTKDKAPKITDASAEKTALTITPVITLPNIVTEAYQLSLTVFEAAIANSDQGVNQVFKHNCNVSGYVDITPNLQDATGNSISPNDSISLNFESCKNSNLLEIEIIGDGTIEIVFKAINPSQLLLDRRFAGTTAEIPSDHLFMVANSETQFSFNKFSITGINGMRQLDGDISDKRDVTSISSDQSLTGSAFKFSGEPFNTELKPFTLSTLSKSGEIGQFSFDGTINDLDTSISYKVETLSPLLSKPDEDYTSGTIAITAAPSVLTMSFDNQSNANLQLDKDGDGVIDFRKTITD